MLSSRALTPFSAMIESVVILYRLVMKGKVPVDQDFWDAETAWKIEKDYLSDAELSALSLRTPFATVTKHFKSTRNGSCASTYGVRDNFTHCLHLDLWLFLSNWPQDRLLPELLYVKCLTQKFSGRNFFLAEGVHESTSIFLQDEEHYKGIEKNSLEFIKLVALAVPHDQVLMILLPIKKGCFCFWRFFFK